MASLSIAPSARADLRDIRVFSKAAFGAKVALAYLDGLREQFATVMVRPRLGKPEPDVGNTVRSIGFRSRRIYYQPIPDGILIIRILHHAQDIRGAFGTGW